MKCKVCSCDHLIQHVIKEMMLGLGDQFEYYECTDCGFIQIANIPEDLSRYYPQEYYSYAPAIMSWKGKLRCSIIRNIVIARANSYYPLHSILKHIYNPDVVDWLAYSKVKFDQHILDVGCGAGHFLLNLHYIGYKHLTGIDPYLETEQEIAPNLRLHRKQLDDLDDMFDFIVLHHSLEHMPDQHSVMSNLHRLLKSHGRCLIRIPIAAQAWREYKNNWVQLDAPRHLCTHTERSFRILAEQHKFSIERVEYDSTTFQFWASEQYQNGIPLQSANSLLHQLHSQKFKQQMKKQYGNKVDELNASNQGDQACFYISKK